MVLASGGGAGFHVGPPDRILVFGAVAWVGTSVGALLLRCVTVPEGLERRDASADDNDEDLGPTPDDEVVRVP